MVDDTLLFDGDERVNQSIPKDDIDETGFNAGDEEDHSMDEDEDLDDPADGDFKLDGPEDVGSPEEQDDDKDVHDPEYNDNMTSHKRKRIRFNVGTTPSQSIQRSTMDTAVVKTEAFILNEDNEFLNKQSTRVPGTFGRQNRKMGECLPAYHKRVSHILDSDDERMMELRDKGYADRQIAEKLAREGRVRYDQKSISTRIMRIRIAQAGHVDFLIKEGYKEWEFQDDCLLLQAQALADIEISYEVERIRAWRFRKVSEYMRRLNKDALFSESACRERYNALIEGTAIIPIEEDDDPYARRTEMEQYCSSREEARNQEEAAKAAQEAFDLKAKNDLKARNAQKTAETANRRAEEENRKAANMMSRAANAQMRAQRAQEHSDARAMRIARINKEKAFKVVKAAQKKRAANSNVSLTIANIKVTADTPDPRGFLSIQDLTQMCAERGLDVADKTLEQLVQGLRDLDVEWSSSDLKKMCRSKGLSTSGNMVQMRYRIALTAAQLFGSFAPPSAAAKGEDDAAATSAANADDEDLVDAE